MTITKTLPSGVECRMKLITGKAQKLISNAKAKDGVGDMLFHCVESLGSKSKLTREDIGNLTYLDTRFILAQLRLASYEPDFEHKQTWDIDGRSIQHSHKISFTEESISFSNPKNQYSEYDEVIENLDYEIETPITKMKVKFRTLTHKRFVKFSKGINVGDIDANTIFLMRTPKYLTNEKNGSEERVIWRKLSLDDLIAREVEFLRKSIYEHEGRGDAMCTLHHPEVDFLTKSVDIMGLPGFFYPED